jgi:hypothetical protein
MQKLLYILIFFTVSMQAQLHKMPADTEFFYTYGGTNKDEARDIKETLDKGYIIAGTTGSFGQGAASAYIIKTDSLGKHIWSSVQGGSQNDYAYAVELTPDSGFFVAGYSNSFSTNSQFYNSPYCFKLDKTGSLVWQKTVDAGSWSFIYGSCALPDSGFILCGQTYATLDGSADAYLMRLNKNGDTLWTKHYGGIQDEVFNSVCVINKRIYAVGSNITHSLDTVPNGWIVKIDLNGNKLQENFISLGYNKVETIINNITPYQNSLFTICGKIYYPDSNATLGLLARIDTSFTSTSNTYLDSVGLIKKDFTVEFNKIINISYGNVCAVGSAIGGYGGTNMFFVGFNDTIGAINYYAFLRHSGGMFNDYGYSGILGTNGDLIGVGSTLGFGGMPSNYCINPNMGLEDYFLVRFNSDSISNSITYTKTNCFADTLFLWQASVKNYTNDLKVKLFPNPASNYGNLEIICEEQKNFTASVYSVLGNEIMSEKIHSNSSNTLDFSALSDGSYFLKIQSENGQNISILKLIINR